MRRFARSRFLVDLAPLRASRDFRLVFASTGVSRIGSFLTMVTVPYQAAVLTGDPLMVGLLGAVELAPLMVTAFVGGALADYLDRRLLVLGGEAAFAALTGVLLVNAVVGHPRLWLLYLVALLTSTVSGLHRPALEGMIPRLVPPDQLPAVAALDSLTGNIAALAGPALAGVLIASFGLPTVYAIDLVTFGFSLACLVAVRAVPPPPGAERPSVRGAIFGLRYAVGRPELLGTYLVDITAMLFAMPMALFPFLADGLGGPRILGLLYAAPSAGALLVAVSSAWTRRVHRHGLAVLLAAAGWGVAILGVGFARTLWLALLGLAVAGACDMVSGLFRRVIWNQTIPDHLRGRLAGIEMLSYNSGPMLGNVRSGLSARWLGIGGSVVAGGALCVLGVGVLAVLLPGFTRYNGADGLAGKQAADQARAAAAGR